MRSQEHECNLEQSEVSVFVFWIYKNFFCFFFCWKSCSEPEQLFSLGTDKTIAGLETLQTKEKII